MRTQYTKGQKVRGDSAYYCGSCKQTIMITATVVSFKGNKLSLTDMVIPEHCVKCKAPKPFYYPWEIFSDAIKPSSETPG